jgi:hypothetical protein
LKNEEAAEARYERCSDSLSAVVRGYQTVLREAHQMPLHTFSEGSKFPSIGRWTERQKGRGNGEGGKGEEVGKEHRGIKQRECGKKAARGE